MSNWRKIKVQVSQSQFSAYQKPPEGAHLPGFFDVLYRYILKRLRTTERDKTDFWNSTIHHYFRQLFRNQYANQKDGTHSQHDQRHLLDGVAQLRALMQTGDQVGNGNVNHARRSQCQKGRHDALHRLKREIGQPAARQHRQAGQHVDAQGLRLAVSGMQQDQKIADLLRDLVRDDRQRGDDAEMNIDKERRRDDHPVDKIVESVADHDHRAAAAMSFVVVRLAVIVVAMPPQQQLLQREEQQDAGQYRAAHRRRAAAGLHRLGQDVEEYRAEQCSDGIADQRADPMRARAQRKQRGA